MTKHPIALAVLAAAIAAAAAAACVLVGSNYTLQVATSLATYVVLCLSWNIVGGYMGYPSFATAAFFGIGVYFDAITQIAGWPLLASWIGAAAAGGVVAMGLALILLRMRGHYFAIGTIAAVQVFQEISNNWDALTGGAIGLNVPMLTGTPDAVTRFFLFAMTALAWLAFLVTLAVDRTRFGFGLRCIRQNENAARMIGLDVYWYKVAAFVLSGIMAAAAGGIYASMVGYVEPKDAFNILTTITVPVVVMLGGAGTLTGALIGSLCYTVLSEAVWAQFINYHMAVLGGLIIAVVYFLPRGVLGFRAQGLRRRFARVRPAADRVAPS